MEVPAKKNLGYDRAVRIECISFNWSEVLESIVAHRRIAERVSEV